MMVWFNLSVIGVGLLTGWAVLSVRADYARRETLADASVVVVWAAYLSHAAVLIWAAVRGLWPLPLPGALALPVGAVLALAGVVLLAAAIWTFRSVRHMSGKQADELITSGVYAWSRNPQNLGWGLGLLGIALLGRSGLALLLLALFALAVHAYIVWLEEPYLEELYGDSYRRYRGRTRRYVGQKKNKSQEVDG